eukprot:SAG11_NODE_14051_length_627_cov_1.053030_1_plen_176_part_00
MISWARLSGIIKKRHYWLLPCYVQSQDPFTRARRAFCLVTILELYVLWMGSEFSDFASHRIRSYAHRSIPHLYDIVSCTMYLHADMPTTLSVNFVDAQHARQELLGKTCDGRWAGAVRFSFDNASLQGNCTPSLLSWHLLLSIRCLLMLFLPQVNAAQSLTTFLSAFFTKPHQHR